MTTAKYWWKIFQIFGNISVDLVLIYLGYHCISADIFIHILFSLCSQPYVVSAQISEGQYRCGDNINSYQMHWILEIYKQLTSLRIIATHMILQLYTVYILLNLQNSCILSHLLFWAHQVKHFHAFQNPLVESKNNTFHYNT